jgi:hemolysin activation/secretion protein
VWQRSTGRDRARCARALAGALAAHALVAFAQVPPDAGRIQEQLRVPEPPKKPAAPQIRIEPPPGEAKADTPPFFVTSFRVTGATVFPEQRLVALLGEPQRPMRLAEVQALADRITELYRQHGYVVARALIPAQDVRDGVVEVRVVEGRYERIDISNASKVSERRIRGLLGAVSEDALVHGPSLERAVLLISDLAGIQARATLEPGTQPGYTNLVLEIVPARATEYDVSLDNGGSRFTGRYRLSAGATLNGPFDIGDRLSVRALTSGQNLSFVRLAYEAPVGVSGLRAIAYASETDYHLGDQFTSLQASGMARNLGAVFAYPLMRSADRNLRVQLGAEARELDDRIDAFQVHNEKSLGLLQWGGAGDARDGFLGGGITAVQALLTHGRVYLHTPDLAASDATTARTQGHFQKLFLGANRLQRVTDKLRLGLNYTGQLASRNLDSSEKLSVGGITGVRAYPAGEAAGDDVHLLQAELRYNAGTWGSAQLSPLVFLDYARSRINHQAWEGFSGRNTRSLYDAGIGAEWANPGIWFIRGWYAHKLGSEEATADRDKAFRLWFQVGMLF